MLGSQGSDALLDVEDDRDPYFATIEAYAKERFPQLVRKVIARLQRQAPSGLLEGRMLGPKTLWDEVCWFLREGYEGAAGNYPFNTSIDGFCDAVLEEVGDAEAALLSCVTAALAEDPDLLLKPARNDRELRRVLRAYVHESASARDMKKFEIY